MSIALGLLTLFATGPARAQQLPAAPSPGVPLDVPVEVAAETALDYDVPASLPSIEGTTSQPHAPQTQALQTQAPRFLAPHEPAASPLPTPSPRLLDGFALDTNLELSEQPGPNPAYAKYRRSKRTKPGEDRIKLIQRILQVGGYLPGEDAVDGDWGPKSKEALQRFQQDHGLTPDGKLGAWSLRALGLGPRHMSVPEGATLAEVLRKAKGLPSPDHAPGVHDDLENGSPILANTDTNPPSEDDTDLGSVPPDLARDVSNEASKDPVALAAPGE